METLDMMGKACPMPVIEAKKALNEVDSLTVLVDNEIATKNLTKLANSLNCNIEVIEESSEEFKVIIQKSGEITLPTKEEDKEIIASNSYSVVLDNNIMGGGNEELGTALMKSFTYALSEQDIAPEKIICFNGGVKVACEGSDSLEDLKRLEEAGTEIIVCGACLDFYELKDKIAVGEISNMYSIVEAMRESNRIVKP